MYPDCGNTAFHMYQKCPEARINIYIYISMHTVPVVDLLKKVNKRNNAYAVLVCYHRYYWFRGQECIDKKTDGRLIVKKAK